MARDVRQLRAEATEASAAGKHKRALACYLELEQLEPRDAQWSKRAAETYKRLGKDKDAIAAFSRAADRYAGGGFLVQAIAVCKLILQIDPKNDDALRRISSMNEQIGAGPTRAVAMAESNPALASNTAVAALRTGGTGALPKLGDSQPAVGGVREVNSSTGGSIREGSVPIGSTTGVGTGAIPAMGGGSSGGSGSMPAIGGSGGSGSMPAMGGSGGSGSMPAMGGSGGSGSMPAMGGSGGSGSMGGSSGTGSMPAMGGKASMPGTAPGASNAGSSIPHGSMPGPPSARAKPDSVPPPIAMPRTRTPAAIQPPPGAAGMRPPAPPPPGSLASRVDLALESERNRRNSSTPPLNIAVARTKSKPITLPADMPIDAISLKDEIPKAFERQEASGIYVIPIDEPLEDVVEIEAEGSGDHGETGGLDMSSDIYGRASAPAIEIAGYEADDDFDNGRSSGPVIEIEDPDAGGGYDVESDDVAELEMADIEEIPLAEPRLMPAAAATALSRTPLFAGLSQEALESLVQQLTLVHLGAGEVLFHEGDPGDALYVIVEGEIAVQAEGPPRVEMARLGAGAFMGEVALMTDQPRSATVSAVTDAELLRIDRKTLSGVLATHGEVMVAVLRFVRDRLVDRWTRTSPLFRPFDESVRQQIAGRFKFLEIDSGATLLKAGAKPDGLYIVLAGKFNVQRDGAHVATVGPGELIGETALLSGAAFKSQVVANGKSLALCLPASDFRELIMTHPHVLEYIGEAAEHSRKLEIL